MKDKLLHRIDSVELHLNQEYESTENWLGHATIVRQLKAAWLRLSEDDHPMNPRIIGRPGVGKTTLAISVAQLLELPVYILQGTSDTRPDDLIVSPILGENNQIYYTASPLVTAMIRGGVCILDEGNRMSEKCWATLAPLLDHRRYVDSIITGIRIHAHPDFRFVTTMNDDASVYDLPEYISSRLTPQIYLHFPSADEETQIIQSCVPNAENELVTYICNLLQLGHKKDLPFSVRDGIQMAKFGMRLQKTNPEMTIAECFYQAALLVLGDEVAPIVDNLGTPSTGLRPI